MDGCNVYEARMTEKRTCPPGITWRDPEYLKMYAECDVCKKYGDEGSPVRWWGRSSSIVCARKECVGVMQGWWNETCRRVEEEMARERERLEELYPQEDDHW